MSRLPSTWARMLAEEAIHPRELLLLARKNLSDDRRDMASPRRRALAPVEHARRRAGICRHGPGFASQPGPGMASPSALC
jgi:hypothetical protein